MPGMQEYELMNKTINQMDVAPIRSPGTRSRIKRHMEEKETHGRMCDQMGAGKTISGMLLEH